MRKTSVLSTNFLLKTSLRLTLPLAYLLFYFSQLFERETFGMRFYYKFRNLMKPFYGNPRLHKIMTDPAYVFDPHDPRLGPIPLMRQHKAAYILMPDEG